MAKQASVTVGVEDIASILELELGKSLRQFVDDMATEIKTLRIQGLSEEAILDRLLTEYKTKGGPWITLKSKVGSMVDYGLGATTLLTAHQIIAEETRAE